MSDRPPRSNDNTPDEQPDQPENEVETQSASTIDSSSSGESGWQTPSSGWRQPSTQTWRSPQSGPAQSSEVPALPTELEAEPDQTGGWHRPKAEDTPFSDSDQLVVTEAPADEAPDGETPAEETPAAEAPAEPAATETPAAASASTTPVAPEDQVTAAPTPAASTTPAPTPTAPQAPEDMMAMLERLDTENDDDQFSMSELIALASLVDEEPRADVRASDAVPGITSVLPAATDEDSGDIALDALTPAERAVLQQQTQGTPPVASDDPAEYARQQLAALGGTGPAAATETPPQETSATAGTSNEDYIRQQLAQLNNAIPPGADQGTIPPAGTGAAGAATTSGLNPREEELARRFAETEEEVRTLRQMVSAGQISQEQFEEQLRNLMILDDDQVWWMIGAESDNWYKYLNNDWVPAVPPRLPTSDYYVNSPLPSLESQPIPSTIGTGPTVVGGDDIELDEYNMPVPRSNVPVVDPDRTMVGASYLDPYLTDRDRTVQAYGEASQPTIASAPISDITVASPAVPAAYGAIESPIVAATPPATDITPYAPTYEEAAEAYRSNQVRNLVFAGLAVLGVVFLLGVGAILLVLSWYNGIVEEYEVGITGLVNYQPQFQTVTLLDYADRPLATLSQAGQERIEVALDDVSPYLIHAIVSTQNSTFYNDPGWNLGSAIETYIDNVLNNPIDDTAPTITQQVARSLVVQDVTGSPETMLDSYVVAGELTRQYDKNFILRLFLNESFFGNQTYGVEAASQFYFNLPASDLDMAQSAMLAGILENPGTYDPITNREVTLAHMNDVLLRMGQVGCLNFQHGTYAASNQQFCVTPTDVNASQTTLEKSQVARDLRRRPRQDNLEYPHFITLVRQQLETAFGATQLYSSGYTVTTSLVPELQDYAQGRLEARLLALSSSGISQGSAIITEPGTGYIRVYLGSEDFYDPERQGETDYARTYQPPGETIHPMIYAAAFNGLDRNGDGTLTNDEYLTPASIMWDVPVSYELNPAFSPINDSNQFYGPIPARIALAGNYNVSAVKALEYATVDNFVNTSREMGIRWEENTAFGLPSALGQNNVRLYDMMVAYGTMANGGNRIPLRAVVSIRDRNGNDVPLPDTLQAPAQQGAISNSIAFLLQNIMSDDVARVNSGAYPQNSPLNIANIATQNWVGAQAGTSEGSRDMWTMGYVTNAVVGVWLGRPDDGPINQQTGLSAAAPLWNELMAQTIASNQRNRPTQFPLPGNNSVNTVPICPDTGVQQGGPCASPIRNEYFAINRQPPPANQGLVGTVEVNSWTRLLVTDACSQPEDRITLTYVNINDPSAIAWLNSAAGRAYAQRIGLPETIISRPTAGCDVNTVLPTANVTGPTPNQSIQGPIDILGQVSAPNLNRYTLEYAPLNTQSWVQISTSNVAQPIPNSVLGRWDTTPIANGQYTLRLGVFSNEGGFVYRTVPVVINNPTPTPTPTPTETPIPTATQFIPPTIPTIPFDPVATIAPVVPTTSGAVGATLPPLPFDGTVPTPTVDTSGS
jgi:membrane peptidoglycan carboxypeptidase